MVGPKSIILSSYYRITSLSIPVCTKKQRWNYNRAGLWNLHDVNMTKHSQQRQTHTK